MTWAQTLHQAEWKKLSCRSQSERDERTGETSHLPVLLIYFCHLDINTYFKVLHNRCPKSHQCQPHSRAVVCSRSSLLASLFFSLLELFRTTEVPVKKGMRKPRWLPHITMVFHLCLIVSHKTQYGFLSWKRVYFYHLWLNPFSWTSADFRQHLSWLLRFHWNTHGLYYQRELCHLNPGAALAFLRGRLAF